MTTQQLADIGARAAEQVQRAAKKGRVGVSICPVSDYWNADAPARQAFAQAVAEAVKAEWLGKYNACNDARLQACDDRDEARVKLEEITERHVEMCNVIQECVQKYNIGLGGEKIDRLVVDEVATLRAQLAEKEARLAKLEWRPVSVRPTEADADSEGFVQALDRDGFGYKDKPTDDMWAGWQARAGKEGKQP